MLSQNFGYERSSLLNVLGWMTDESSKGLALKDALSVKSAARKHKLEKGTTAHHRRKIDWSVPGKGWNEGVTGGAGGSGNSGSVGASVVNDGAGGSGISGSVAASGVNDDASNEPVKKRRRKEGGSVYRAGGGD